MNFKDKYQQENEEITLDAAFTSRLAEQMKKEQQIQRRRKKMMVSIGGVAAAAVMCVVVLQGVNTSKQPEQTEKTEVQNKAEAVETQIGGHSFGRQAWYGDAETEEEIFAAFRTLLRDEQIEKLYCSDTEEYEEENILPADEAEKVVKALQNAEAVDAEAGGGCKYYMAVFENGNIVKFEIYGEKYLKLKDSGALYSY